MKHTYLLIILMMYSAVSFADENLSNWSYTLTQQENSNYEILLRAEISEDWYIYGMNLSEGKGPLPLYLSFDESDDIKVLEDFYEVEEAPELFDEVFNITVSYYDGVAEFSSVIRADNPHGSKIIIDGQACNKNDGRCVQVFEKIKIDDK